eukprot:TRINITY_DN5942_c0_g1_i2.p1 TRINITY_DN5942_c0_g1~~TRINITY_DN5942_c0_g1_i2.p1  ORF type:complete len:315 (-),score=61.16 TRINITY_DN5942_c0_g1_i2:614-1558(-)
MASAFESLRSLTNDIVRIDVPVPACLNHCINQEVFCCKVCGEMFDNIHKYIAHGKVHRSTSLICSWCGGTWPSYAALCIHQLVWDSNGKGGTTDPKAKVGGTENSSGKLESPKDDTDVNSDEDVLTCPKCSTKVSNKVGLSTHLAFQCTARSKAVKQRTDQYLAAHQYSHDPLLPLTQEIQSLILHLRELLGNSNYRQSFEEEGERADSKYDQLAPNFTKQHLTWMPMGYTLQVLESEGDNFAVIFDIWSQVVDRLSGPEELKELTGKLESELTAHLNSGISPRWPPIAFDQAMLDTPDQQILTSLESQLGWVK